MRYFDKSLSIIFFLIGLFSFYAAYLISTFNSAWTEDFNFKDFLVEGWPAIIFAILYLFTAALLWKKSRIRYILVLVAIISSFSVVYYYLSIF